MQVLSCWANIGPEQYDKLKDTPSMHAMLDSFIAAANSQVATVRAAASRAIAVYWWVLSPVHRVFVCSVSEVLIRALFCSPMALFSAVVAAVSSADSMHSSSHIRITSRHM